jgi:hypothetical protein
VGDYRWGATTYQNTWLGIVPQDVATTYYHKGEDFGAVPDLLPVFASEAGRVTTAQDSVQLRAPDGTLTRLFHMNPPRVLVAAGQSVVAGQRLGLTGKFGNGDADPHLHWDFRCDGDEPRTYPFAVDAYLRDYPDAGVAIAGGYQFMRAGETLVLDGGRSLARPGRAITGYRWILHDGTAVAGATAKLTVATPGFYAQELRVFFDDGREERGFTPVRVFAPDSPGQAPVPASSTSIRSAGSCRAIRSRSGIIHLSSRAMSARLTLVTVRRSGRSPVRGRAWRTRTPRRASTP